MSHKKYIQAIHAADQLTIKALRAEFDHYKRNTECASKLFDAVLEFKDAEISRLKAENEQLQKYIYQHEVKL